MKLNWEECVLDLVGLLSEFRRCFGILKLFAIKSVHGQEFYLKMFKMYKIRKQFLDLNLNEKKRQQSEIRNQFIKFLLHFTFYKKKCSL